VSKEITMGHCHSCLFRHSCCFELPKRGEFCPHWKLGQCYTCKYINAPDEEWFKRGCEAWCFGGCEQYKRNWKTTIKILKSIDILPFL